MLQSTATSCQILICLLPFSKVGLYIKHLKSGLFSSGTYMTGVFTTIFIGRPAFKKYRTLFQISYVHHFRLLFSVNSSRVFAVDEAG